LGGIGRLLALQRRENPHPCTTRKDGAPRDTLEGRLSATRRKKKQIPHCVRDDIGKNARDNERPASEGGPYNYRIRIPAAGERVRDEERPA